MKSNFLVFAWLILLQVCFVSHMKGQYEDILCQEWVKEVAYEFINDPIYNCTEKGSFSIRLGNHQGITYIQFYGYHGTFGLAYDWKGKMFTESGILVNAFDSNNQNIECGYCDEFSLDNEQYIYFCSDEYPYCIHKNFETYSGTLKNKITGPANCENYPLYDTFMLGERIQLFTYIALYDEKLKFKFHTQLLCPDGTTKDFFGENFGDFYYGQAWECLPFIVNHLADKAGTYTVKNYIVYSEVTPFNYITYDFVVKNNDPVINPGQNFFEICSAPWIRDTLKPYNFFQYNNFGWHGFGVAQNPVGDTVYTLGSYGFLGSYIKYFDKNGQYLGYVKTGETGDIQETDLSTPSNWMHLYFIWDQRFGPYECLDNNLGNSPDTPYHICDQKTIIVDTMAATDQFNFGCCLNCPPRYHGVKYFKFKTWETGNLTFKISPNKADDNFDFVVYKGSKSNDSIVRCMANGDNNFNFPSPCLGPTGLAHNETDTSNIIGCNGINNFLKPLYVNRNEEYILQIFNFTGESDAGFKLEFDFDGERPFLVPEKEPIHFDFSVVRYPFAAVFGNSYYFTSNNNTEGSYEYVNLCDSLLELHAWPIYDTLQIIEKGNASCPSYEINAGFNYGVTFKWSTGSTASKIEVSPSGTAMYSVTITDIVGDTIVLDTLLTGIECFCTNHLCTDPDNLTLSAPIVDAPQNANVCIPIRVRNFNQIQFGQGSISWDPTLLSYKEVRDFDLLDLNEGNLGLNNTASGSLTYEWNNSNPATPINLPDSTILMELCFDVIGAVGQESCIIFGQGATPTDWGNDNGTIPICLEYGKVTITNQVCVFSDIEVTHTTCGLDNGTITLADVNGCTYKWPDGMETSERTNLSAGDYIITLMPSMIDTVITINSSNSLNVGNLNIIQPNCGLSNGSIELPQGTSFTYRWDDGNTNSIRNNLPYGTYQVTISDGVCEDIRNIILSTSSGLNATFTNNRQPTCGQSNGKITLNTGSVGHSFLLE